LGADTIDPDSVCTELNPDWMLPATTPTVPEMKIAAIA
jgi:hypothetical protein